MVDLADVFSILKYTVIPNANLLLIMLSLFLIYIYWKTVPKTATVKDEKTGQEVPVKVESKPSVTLKLVKFLAVWMGVASMLLGVYSIYLAAWDPFTNLVMIVVGLAATANELYRFPWSAVITAVVLGVIYNAGSIFNISVLFNLQNPYIFGAIGFGSFGALYLKLKFLGDLLTAAGKAVAKLGAFFGFIGLAAGVIALL